MLSSFADINECVTVPDVCAHGRCTNTQGGFRCECFSGYEPTEDGRACVGKFHIFLHISFNNGFRAIASLPDICYI